MEHTESLLQQTTPDLTSSSLQRYCRAAAWLLFLLMVVIGSIPGKAEALSAVTHDKFLHFCAYSILSMLLYIGLGGAPLRRAVGTLFVIGALGLADETIQYFLPYRNSDASDWLFNMLAASLSAALCSTFQRAMTRRRTRFQFDRRVRQKTNRTN
jgi:VanZ family protein